MKKAIEKKKTTTKEVDVHKYSDYKTVDVSKFDISLEVKNVWKSFGTNVVNKDISFFLRRGQVLSVLGENGAGKTTLMSIIFGLYKADKGSILINGKPVSIKNPLEANKYGIGMLPQHFKLVDIFSGSDNVTIGSEISKATFINKAKEKEKLNEIVKKYNLNIDINKKVENLSIGEKQKIEILKILWRDCNIIILDEPTAVLSPAEIKSFLDMIEQFKKEGKSIIFISHKLKEVLQVSDQIMVLRYGEIKTIIDNKNVDEALLSRLMIGETKKMLVFDKQNVAEPKKVLEVKELYFDDHADSLFTKIKKLKNVNFEINSGEILGIAGLDGNYQKELCEVIMGINKPTKGEIIFNGENITDLAIHKKLEKGISFIPEDRQNEGLVLDMNIMHNLILKDTKNFSWFGLLNNKKIKTNAKEIVEKYDVRNASDGKAVTRALSGGNQQKVIIGREISRKHSLLIAMHPTRGLDVGAIQNIYEKIIDSRNNGAAVLLVSSELDEILSVCDRVMVIKNGEIMGSEKTSNITREQIGLMMLGKTKEEISKTQRSK